MIPTKSQIIWYRDTSEEGVSVEEAPLELRIPKIINSDIGFQLQFGPHENNGYWNRKKQLHHESQQPSVQTIDETNYPYKWI